MSIIKTKRNLVAAPEPMAGDVAVVTRVGTAEVVRPIQEYRAAVHEAEMLADHMSLHVDVTPINTDELLAREGMTPESLVASLSPVERDQLRQDCINACTDAVRYSEDPAVVPTAERTLRKLGADNGQRVQ